MLAELTGFQRRGNQVWLLASRDSQIRERAAAANIAVEPLVLGALQFPRMVVQVACWLRRMRIQVLNPHSSRDAWIAGLAGRLARVPFIVRTRHFDVPIANRWLSGIVYRHLTDHILTTSPRVTAHFQESFCLPENRVTTLPTGIDLERFTSHGEVAELVPAAQRKGKPLIGMVAVIRHAKGHETLLQAARQLRDQGFEAHFVIVGEGPNRAHVERRLRDLQLADCVTFTGHREDIPAVLRALSVLAIPSLHEGIPQIGLQALAAQTPVVGSNVGGIPTIIRPGETGRLVPPGDAAALAQSLRETLIETAVTRAFTERGRVLVEQQHSLPGMLDQLDALYRRYLPSAAGE